MAKRGRSAHSPPRASSSSCMCACTAPPGLFIYFWAPDPASRSRSRLADLLHSARPTRTRPVDAAMYDVRRGGLRPVACHHRAAVYGSQQPAACGRLAIQKHQAHIAHRKKGARHVSQHEGGTRGAHASDVVRESSLLVATKAITDLGAGRSS